MEAGADVAGRYRLEELVGRGPMSEVWRAHDSTLDRTVALKVLGPTADLERFQREARAVASLAHEHVMRVYDYGEDEAGPFMALEWLPGGTLEERLGGGALPNEAAHGIAVGIASGLAHLHERGFVHRDLKPANVLFDEEDRAKLADFGLARSAAGAGTLTEAGTVLGTAAYISPEQASGEPATPASDVYSFGVMLFRMLTGALPFIADDALALVDMHRNKPAPAVASVNPGADPALAALTDSALAKDPAARPADGAALLAALGAAPAVAAVEADAGATQVLPAAAAVPPPAPVTAWRDRGSSRAVRSRRLGRPPRLGRDPAARRGTQRDHLDGRRGTRTKGGSTSNPFRTTGKTATTGGATSTQATSTQATSTQATSTQATTTRQTTSKTTQTTATTTPTTTTQTTATITTSVTTAPTTTAPATTT